MDNVVINITYKDHHDLLSCHVVDFPPNEMVI